MVDLTTLLFWPLSLSPDDHSYRTTVNVLTCSFRFTYESLSFSHVFVLFVSVLAWGAHMPQYTCECHIRGQFAVVSVLLLHMDPSDGTQVARLRNKSLYPRSIFQAQVFPLNNNC